MTGHRHARHPLHPRKSRRLRPRAGAAHLNEEDWKSCSSQNLLSIDERRRAIIRVNEDAQARRNAIRRKSAEAKAGKTTVTVERLMAEVAEVRATISTTDRKSRRQVEQELKRCTIAEFPNLPLDEVPTERTPSDNVEHHRFGAKREYAFAPKQHFDLGEALGQMDFETAAKLSGARFVVLKKGFARLERALGTVHARCTY